MLIITSVALLISFVACKDWKKIRHVCSIVLVPLTVFLFSVCQEKYTDSEGGNEESSKDDFSAAEDNEEAVSGITYSRNGYTQESK